MGKGQPWLIIGGCSKVFSSALPTLPFLFFLALIPWFPHVATKSVPPTHPPLTHPDLTHPQPLTYPPFLCPSACQCSGFQNGTTDMVVTAGVDLAVACVQAGLTDLPSNLPPTLTSLDLRGNRLTQLGEHLSSLTQLTYLDVSNNSLTILERGSFHNMTSLATLILSSNAIELLEDQVFESLAAVRTLNLAFNQVTSLTGDMLFGLDNVQVLNLTGNSISTLSNQTFLYLHRLKVLDLSNNRLQYLPTNAFLGLQSVQSVLLHHNYLTNITDAFHGLPELSALDLSYNMLDVLENNTFANLHHLSSLHLSFNNISDISPTFFTDKAQSLKRLDLQGNSLEQLQRDLFASFPLLEKLDVSQMPYLQSISFDAFADVLALRALNLSHNPRLSFLHPQLVSWLPLLANLDLRANNLSVLSHVTFHANPLLTHLYLAHNPFHCGCALAWMTRPSPHSDNTNTSVVSDLDDVQCELPSNSSAVPISQLSQEMLQCNNVTSINVTDLVFAKIGSQLVLQCDYIADETIVLSWTTPRGLVLHYHPYHPEASAHLPQAVNLTEEFHAQHDWHSQPSYDSDLQHNPDHVVLQEDGSLYIDFVLRSDAGPYQCMVHNSVHETSATTTVRLDYTILFEVKIMSLIVGMACAASFLTLNTIYVVIMWGARKLVNKRRRERIHKMLENLDEYRTTQIGRIRTNYSFQLGRIRDHYHTQSIRLKDNYTTQMKRVRQGCSNQVERIRDNYHARLTHLKDYSSHQIQQIRDVTNNQIIRIRDYGSLQMERLRETYKLQQQHVLKVIEAMNLENCRNVVETECMRTESMIFNIQFPDLDDDNTSCEDVSSQPDSVYATALNSDGSSQESLSTVVGDGGGATQGDPITENTTIIVLPSDPPPDMVADALLSTPPDSSSSVLCDHEGTDLDLNVETDILDVDILDIETDIFDVETDFLNVNPGDNCDNRETVV